MAIPSARAVARLSASWNVVGCPSGCCAGRSGQTPSLRSLAPAPQRRKTETVGHEAAGLHPRRMVEHARQARAFRAPSTIVRRATAPTGSIRARTTSRTSPRRRCEAGVVVQRRRPEVDDVEITSSAARLTVTAGCSPVSRLANTATLPTCGGISHELQALGGIVDCIYVTPVMRPPGFGGDLATSPLVTGSKSTATVMIGVDVAALAAVKAAMVDAVPPVKNASQRNATSSAGQCRHPVDAVLGDAPLDDGLRPSTRPSSSSRRKNSISACPAGRPNWSPARRGGRCANPARAHAAARHRRPSASANLRRFNAWPPASFGPRF